MILGPERASSGQERPFAWLSLALVVLLIVRRPCSAGGRARGHVYQHQSTKNTKPSSTQEYTRIQHKACSLSTFLSHESTHLTHPHNTSRSCSFRRVPESMEARRASKLDRKRARDRNLSALTIGPFCTVQYPSPQLISSPARSVIVQALLQKKATATLISASLLVSFPSGSQQSSEGLQKRCDVGSPSWSEFGPQARTIRPARFQVNDATLAVLAKQAVAHAQAGADVLGPSDMMDGRVGVVRGALDAGGFTDVAIMSYSAKYASAFYGPFRDAVGSGGLLKGDKASYQLSAGNQDEGVAMAARDLREGADMVMVKPGLPYLDLCQRISSELGAATFAYQVSGEYAMIEAAGANGWIDRDRAVLESLMAFKRAGCRGVLSYYAFEIASLMMNGEL